MSARPLTSGQRDALARLDRIAASAKDLAAELSEVRWELADAQLGQVFVAAEADRLLASIHRLQIDRWVRLVAVHGSWESALAAEDERARRRALIDAEGG